MAEVLEKGNIYYFYRPKVDAVTSRDIQQFSMVLKTGELYRLIVIGAKELPEAGPRQKPRRRRWAQIRRVSKNLKVIEYFLRGGEYQTKTKGTRHLPSAAPVGEGRYALARHHGHTELVHRLKKARAKEIEKTFTLNKEQSFIVAVKNPDIHMEGFPKTKPSYPSRLKERFQGRRWIPADDPGLLNYPNVQLVLIGARNKEAAKELGISIGDEADVLSELQLDVPSEPILENAFPPLEEFRKRHHWEKIVEFPTKGRQGGRKGGSKASQETGSVSAAAKLLGGIDFPKNKTEVLDYARKHKSRLTDPKPALELIERFPDKTYRTMADIGKAAGKAVPQRFECPLCGESFKDRSSYNRHLRISHPKPAVSAADIEHALSGITYPMSKPEILDYAKKQGAENRVLKALNSLPDRNFRDAAELGKAFQEAVTGKKRTYKKAPSKKAAETGSAAALAKALKGIKFPQDKRGLLEHAEKQKARREIIRMIEKFPDRRYRTMADIMKGLGES